MRLDNITIELATLAPRGLFRTWHVERRLGVLGKLEQALLDSENQFEQADVQLRFSSASPGQNEEITFEKTLAVSNASALADGNGGVPLPLNAFVGIDLDQTFELQIDADANPAGALMRIADVLLLAEYGANY